MCLFCGVCVGHATVPVGKYQCMSARICVLAPQCVGHVQSMRAMSVYMLVKFNFFFKKGVFMSNK